MKVSMRGWQQALGLAVAIVLLAGGAAWAATVPSLITQPINNAKLKVLKGNISPYARPIYDHGLAPDSLPTDRMLLVLKRSPQQQSALDHLLTAQQEKSSPDYHHWLTPAEFGKEFGPSNSDIQTVTNWLMSEGFKVNQVTNGRMVIEFSGTAGLVRQVFHAEIHKYIIKGKSYWANSTDPQIPVALAPAVAGIASLNNFPRNPMLRKVGVFSRSKKTGKVKPLYTFNCPTGYTCGLPAYYAIGPTDFATIYNVLPLWNAGIDGTGETIAIVSDSNIDTSDVANFRSMFGLPANPVNVILDGPNPGFVPGSETEADADTEWAGAVAKNAKIDLVVSEDTETTSGIDLSALYIIDNDIAPVLSESYGACEAALGNAGNAFENAMWQQAAAEGITVVVAAGDSGSAGCDNPNLENAAQNGLAVSGTASTPFNVAAGGTDFSDPSSYFSATNNSTTQDSALSYVPEITWNDSCASSGLATGCESGVSSGDLTAGGGGESNCAVQNSSGTCSAGYSKPAWQTGPGVPADSVRDVPDISLFAGDGLNAAFYVVCSSGQTDILGSGLPASCISGISALNFLGVGGTSLAAPDFAGIMALVNEKTGHRQGNANFVLYPLAAAAAKNGGDCTSNAAAVTDKSCVFYDITQGHNASGTDVSPGNNSVACLAGSPDCDAPTGSSDGILVQPGSTSTPAWTTSTGYDLATGLGSVNAANLVDNWNSVSFHSSATTLSLTPTTITHGQSVTASIKVTFSAGTPTGDVELMGNPKTATNPTGSNNVGIADFQLGSSGTFSGTTDMLPGGTYNVFAHYAGDGISGSSDSTPIQVTVNPESSQTRLSFVAFNLSTGTISGTGPTPPSVYGSAFYLMRVDVLNSAGDPCSPTASNGEQVQPTFGCPTGTVTLTDNGLPLTDLGGYNTLPLNSQGYMEDQSVDLGAGSHSVAASYSGDSSYNPSSTTENFTISKAPTTVAASLAGSSVSYGIPVEVTATLSTSSLGAAPNGSFTFFVDGKQIGNSALAFGTASNLNSTPPSYAYANASTYAAFTSVGTDTLSTQYSGDTNYQSATSGTVSVTVTKALPNFFTYGANPTSINLGEQTTLTAQLDGSSEGSAPTGTITFYSNGNAITGTVTYTSGSHSLSASMPYTPKASGLHDITVAYSGDSNYQSTSATTPSALTVQQPNFQITAGGNVDIADPGQSGSASIKVSSVAGFTGTVDLTCAVTTPQTIAPQDMPTCSLNPTSVTLSSSSQDAISTVTVDTTAAAFDPPAPLGWPPTSHGPLGLWLGLLGLLSLLALAWSRTRSSVRNGFVPRMLRSHGSPQGTTTFRWGLMMGLTVLLGVTLLCSSCGGGGSTGGGGSSNSGTPSGPYTLTVTGTSGNLTHLVKLTITVE